MPDDNEPAEPLMSREDSIALMEEQIRAEVNTPRVRYIYQQLTNQVVDAEREAIAWEMARHVTNDIDREFISSLSSMVVNPAPPMRTIGGNFTQPRCNICGQISCRHLGGTPARRIRQSRIDDLVEADFHRNLSGEMIPAIDRLASTSILHTRLGSPIAATIYLRYYSYDQLRTHLYLSDNPGVNHSVVWFRDNYWAINSMTVATADTVGGYEVTLELVSSATNTNRNTAPELTLTEAPNGQTEWVLDTTSPINNISVDLTIANTGVVTNLNPNASVSANVEEDSIEPSTVLKKAKCPICQKRGCVSSHIPTSAELEQSLNSVAATLNSADLDQNQSAAVRTAFETAFDRVDLAQQLNAVARMINVQETFIPLQHPSTPLP